MRYEPIIGLEIHVQLKTKSKLFCGCDNSAQDAPPNTLVCPICMGHPGVLPVLNKQALEYGLMAALALNCKIPEKAKFDRKNYFYPDLPKGYQISMFDEPICLDGLVPIDIPATLSVAHGDAQRPRTHADIRITRIHLEEDAAKSSHADGKTYVDFNRGGTPLIETVTEPDFRSALEAKVFLQELRRIMRYLDVSDADMEKGHMRCDANISLRPKAEGLSFSGEKDSPSARLHPKTEIKNINSFRAVERAIQYEIQRQTKLWEEGKPPAITTTRGWDDAQGMTVGQRKKEDSSDYHYFPEPDLPPLLLHEVADQVRLRMPELPHAKRVRFIDEYGLSHGEAMILTEEKPLADYVEKVMMELRGLTRDIDEEGTEEEKWNANRKKLVKLFSGWFITKLFGLMEKHAVHIRTLKITPENFAELLMLMHSNRVNSTAALQILEEMLLTGGDPSQIMEEKKLEQVSNNEEITPIVQEVIDANPQPVADFKSGKLNALQFLVGQVMKSSRGKANPDLAQKLLQKLLK